MERFVRFSAPQSKLDFAVKLFIFMTICGAFNHLRDVIMNAPDLRNTFLKNFTDAAFTALPMCSFALLLIGHLNGLQLRLYRQANRDVLTGLPNRRWFMNNTPDQMRDGQALFIIDIDHFKRINDRFGHDAGDRCLQQMAANLIDLLQKGEPCARIGGEEFAVFIPDTDPDAMRQIGDRISAGFPFAPWPDEVLQVTASVGIACGTGRNSRQDALRLADDAVYRAKESGRARCVISRQACTTYFGAQMQAAE